MPRTKTAGRGTNGAGSIRKITTEKNGKTYTYWQARYTAGFDPATGKQVQRSITGKTKQEVAQKLRQVTAEIDQGTYCEPCKLTVGEWLDIWQKDFLVAVKPRTRDCYQTVVDAHLKAKFGTVRLDGLRPHEIQRFYNELQSVKHLSGKTIHNIHGVFHKALQQAVDLGYLRANPASACKLPRKERAEIKPLDSDMIQKFLEVCKGHRYETVYIVTLFTGMREGEVLGLTWDCVDFVRGTVTINKQLQRERRGSGAYRFISPKNGKSRCITPAPFIMEVLKRQRDRQTFWKSAAGSAWEDNDLVFTNELGRNLSAQTVYLHFKKLAERAGFPDARFHDLRHSYAVAALQSGDDIKTVQENLGHHTAAFTLDVYGHVTEQMKQASAARMERFIQSVASHSGQ